MIKEAKELTREIIEYLITKYAGKLKADNIADMMRSSFRGSIEYAIDCQNAESIHNAQPITEWLSEMGLPVLGKVYVNYDDIEASAFIREEAIITVLANILHIDIDTLVSYCDWNKAAEIFKAPSGESVREHSINNILVLNSLLTYIDV